MSNWLWRVWRWWFGIPMSLRFAIGIWLMLLIGVFVRVAISRPDQQSVLPIYLLAAERLKVNENLYADPPAGMDIYRNPPAVAALFVPFTFLDPKLAAILWRVLGISLYLLGIRNLLRDVLPPLTSSQRAWVWIISAALILPAFNNAQINLPIVATALLGTAAAARSQWQRAALWLVLCGWFKVYTAAVGLLMAVGNSRTLPLRLIVTGFFYVGGTWLAVEMWGSVSQYWEVQRAPLTDFLQASQMDDRSAAPLERAPKDWTIVVRVWLGVVVPKSISLGVSLLVAVAMASWIWFRFKGDVLQPLVLGLIWLTLFGPATEMNTYSVLAPVAGVLCVVGRWPWLAQFGTLLLVFAVLRGAFPQEWGWHLHWFQPLGSIMLLTAQLSNPTRYSRWPGPP